MRTALTAALAFLAAHPTSVRGYVNFRELGRSILTALGATSLVGLALAVLTAIGTNAGAIFSAHWLAVGVSFAAGVGA